MKLQRKLSDKVSSVRPQVQDQTTKITHNSPKDEHSVVEVKVILPFILTQTKTHISQSISKNSTVKITKC